MTERIQLGTGICLIIERDAITTAKEIASLDMISNGRAIIGIGAGWNREEMENHGASYAHRWAIVREKTLACLQSITPAELERELEAPGGATRTAGASLGVLLLDHFHHSGQVCYLRGFITGKGWFAA